MSGKYNPDPKRSDAAHKATYTRMMNQRRKYNDNLAKEQKKELKETPIG